MKQLKRKMTDTSKMWLSKEDLRDAVEECRGQQASDKLVQMLYGIADHLLASPRYRAYKPEIKEDLRQEMVIKQLKNLKNLKPDKSESYYGYLHQACYSAACNYLSKMYRHINTVNFLRDQMSLEHDCDGATAPESLSKFDVQD